MAFFSMEVTVVLAQVNQNLADQFPIETSQLFKRIHFPLPPDRFLDKTFTTTSDSVEMKLNKKA